MWESLKKSRMEQFTPWRAIPAIAAEKITMPLGIMRYWGTVCRSIKSKSRLQKQTALYISSILFPVISARTSVLVLKIPDTFSK